MEKSGEVIFCLGGKEHGTLTDPKSIQPYRTSRLQTLAHATDASILAADSDHAHFGNTSQDKAVVDIYPPEIRDAADRIKGGTVFLPREPDEHP